jgi:hypothetical protein
MKSDGCVACNQLGNFETRTHLIKFDVAFTGFSTGEVDLLIVGSTKSVAADHLGAISATRS